MCDESGTGMIDLRIGTAEGATSMILANAALRVRVWIAPTPLGVGELRRGLSSGWDT